MKIRLLAFASAGDALGTHETEIEIPDGSRISDLRAHLDRDHPAMIPLWPRLAVALNGRIVPPDTPLEVPITCPQRFSPLGLAICRFVRPSATPSTFA